MLLLWLTLLVSSQPCLFAAVPLNLPQLEGRCSFHAKSIPSISWAHGGVKCSDPPALREPGSWGVQRCRSEAGLAEGPGVIPSCGVLNS